MLFSLDNTTAQTSCFEKDTCSNPSCPSSASWSLSSFSFFLLNDLDGLAYIVHDDICWVLCVVLLSLVHSLYKENNLWIYNSKKTHWKFYLFAPRSKSSQPSKHLRYHFWGYRQLRRFGSLHCVLVFVPGHSTAARPICKWLQRAFQMMWTGVSFQLFL